MSEGPFRGFIHCALHIVCKSGLLTMQEGFFGRMQKTNLSIIKRAQLYEKRSWTTSKTQTNRVKQFPLIAHHDDLKHTLSCSLIWILFSDQYPVPKLWLSYKLFDRWVHKEINIRIESWQKNDFYNSKDSVLYVGALLQKQYRLMESLLSNLVPQIKAFVNDVTWTSALYNPKLQVPNLNTIVVHSSNQGVELVGSKSVKANIELNIKEVSLQLVLEKSGRYMNCSSMRRLNIQSLSDGLRILKTFEVPGKEIQIPNFEARKEQFILETLNNLCPKTHPREATIALQHILSSIGRLSQGTSSSPIVSMWIQYGLIPRLLCLLMDSTRCNPGIFQLTKNICKGLIHYEEELASKALILYICRCLQQFGLRRRSVLVLISCLMESPSFRKIAILHFDLGQNFARLLLVGKPSIHGSDSATDHSSLSFNSSTNQESIYPAHIISEQQHLPVEATSTWRVPPVPLHSNPPEDSLCQISLLKNLLLLSPLNNKGVEFRSGHLTSMLLAFTDCGLAENFRDQDSGQPSARESDDAWFFVFHLVLANIHEHSYHHPNHIPIPNISGLVMVKPRMELKVLEGFIKQILTIIPSRGHRLHVRVGFKLLTELITSTPSPILASLVATYLPTLISNIRLSPTKQEVQSGSRSSAHLSVFSLLVEVLKRAQPCPLELMKTLVEKNMVSILFQTIGFSSEQKEMNRMDDEEAVVWIQKCWRLLTALTLFFRQHSIPDDETTLLLFNEIESQLIIELKDPFCFSSTDSVDILASLEFLVVYLDHPQCLLYQHEEILVRIVRWLRENLNRSWNDKDSDLIVGCLEVVSVLCERINEASSGMLQIFIDGLLTALQWINPPATPSSGEKSAGRRSKVLSDRTVRVEAVLPEEFSPRNEDWKTSEPGPSQPPSKPKKKKKKSSFQTRGQSEIQPDFSCSSSMSGSSTLVKDESLPSHRDGRLDEVNSRGRVEESVESYPIMDSSPSCSTEEESKIGKTLIVDPSRKLEKFRSKHEFYIPEKTQKFKENLQHEYSGNKVIPPLNLKPLNVGYGGGWHIDQRSVGSTEYSSDLPIRPLSQISDFSGDLLPYHDQRRPPPIETTSHHLPTDSTSLGFSPESRQAFHEFELGSLDCKSEVHSRRAKTAPLNYLDHEEEADLDVSKDLIENESPINLPSSYSTPWNDESLPHLELDLQPGRLNLQKRASSTSAMADLVAAQQCRQSNKAKMDSSNFYKMHSFDHQCSRSSLAMRQLVGDMSPMTVQERPPIHTQQHQERYQDLNPRTQLPNIVLNQQEIEKSSLYISEAASVDTDVLSGTTITLFAGSDIDDIQDLDVNQLFHEEEKAESGRKNQESGRRGHSKTLSTDSKVLLASKYRLSRCELVLDDYRVHSSVLKVFLKLLWAEYTTRSKEGYLSRVISLGLHKHFHFLPKTILMSLKDWAIQEQDPSYYTLLKLLAKDLFDEAQYPSLKRIGRGVFSSIHECSCPILGGPSKCCAKVVDLPKDPHDIRSFKDLYVELLVLQRLQHLPQIVSLYDFGCTQDNLFLVTKLYKTDLLTWRRGIIGSPLPCAKMMFKVFLEILKVVEKVHEAGVVHFDLKCSNIVLDVASTKQDMYQWREEHDLPFNIILADFGEALFVDNIPYAAQRSRGTQAFMSPEVLLAGSGPKKILPNISTDTWSLGCLLFELITSQPLFDDSNYSEFHTRLTTTTRTLIDARRVEWIPESIREPTLLCLSYLLVRNPALRAPLQAVVEWVENLLASTVLPPPSPLKTTLLNSGTTSVRNLRGLEDYVVLPQHLNLDLRGEFVPTSARVCLLSLTSVRDPWTLSEHKITHLVFVHYPSEDQDFHLIKNSAVRATAAVFQFQIPTEEETSNLSWTETTKLRCEFILEKAQQAFAPRIGIVPGHKTGHYVQLIVRYLSRYGHQIISLDSTLLS